MQPSWRAAEVKMHLMTGYWDIGLGLPFMPCPGGASASVRLPFFVLEQNLFFT